MLFRSTLANDTRIETTYDGPSDTGTWWGASVFGLGREGGFGISVDPNNRFVGASRGNDGVIRYCDYKDSSSVVPVANSALYATEIELFNCDISTVNGVYTGLTTLPISGSNNTLLLAFTDGEYGFFEVYKLLTR